jgi:hypothetical protein
MLHLPARPADNSRLSAGGFLPEGEQLRRALRWLGEQQPCTPSVIEEAGQRFGLSPIEKMRLYRWFFPHI